MSAGTSTGSSSATAGSTPYYRVRKTWADASSQKGAFTSLANAKACADQNAGYYVFDPDGNAIYPTSTGSAAFTPYTVKVETDNLRIRKGPGTGYGYWTKNGKTVYTGKGTFTIVDESDGTGASKWGLLKSYEKDRDGWISLDYAKKI